MNRRELLAVFGLAAFTGCRGGDASRSEPPRNPESTVTLTVDGMI